MGALVHGLLGGGRGRVPGPVLLGTPRGRGAPQDVRGTRVRAPRRRGGGDRGEPGLPGQLGGGGRGGLGGHQVVLTEHGRHNAVRRGRAGGGLLGGGGEQGPGGALVVPGVRCRCRGRRVLVQPPRPAGVGAPGQGARAGGRGGGRAPGEDVGGGVRGRDHGVGGVDKGGDQVVLTPRGGPGGRCVRTSHKLLTSCRGRAPGLPACRQGLAPAQGARALGAGLAGHALAGDGDADVVEGHVQGRLGLVDADLHLEHAGEGQDHVGNALGQGLDEVDALPGNDLHDGVGHGGVVHGVVQVVGHGGHDGPARAQVHGDVGQEELPLLLLKGQDTVETTG